MSLKIPHIPHSSALHWAVLVLLVVIVAVNSYSIYHLSGQVSQLESAVENAPSASEPATESATVYEPPRVVEASIPVVSVSTDGQGSVDNLSLRLIPGDNNILINTNPFLETDLQYAINTAVTYAKLKVPNYGYDRDFIFDFRSKQAQLVGGESAGAATAILTIAMLQGKELKKDAVITGTINADGSIGKIAGVLEKAKAVSDAGFKYFLVPAGQASITYYERSVERQPSAFGFDILRSRYIPKTLNLTEEAKKAWGLEVVEVASIDQALPYFAAD